MAELYQFKQTFIRYNLYIRRRDYDNKWEVVKKIVNPQYKYDSTWKGPRTAKKKIIKPMVWITHHVFNSRQKAVNKAKEISKNFKNSS